MILDNFSENALKNSKHIHFIGIGGSGTFPLVQILQSEGHLISGSDNNYTDTIALEEKMGIQVTIGQSAENIQGADLIVYSAAIMEDNPELIAAKESSIPAIERSVLLGTLSQRYNRTIGVSGTHGKTTTSTMLTQVLLETPLDPTVVLGGKLSSIGGNGRPGKSDVFVVEACEFVDTFLKISPWMVILLNIDADHLDYFKTMERLTQSFRQFADSASGPIIYNGDDQNTIEAIKDLDKEKISFGEDSKNNYYFSELENHTHGESFKQTFQVWENGEKLMKATLSIPGKHNVMNAMAVIAASRYLKLNPETILYGLQKFRGAGRRFEIMGHKNNITIADDYAHHPTEIRATLEAAQKMGYHEIWVIFQPFTFSRTVQHMDAFAETLALADHVLLTPIMGSREKNTYNVYSSDLAAKIPNAKVFETFEEIGEYALTHAQPGDLIITMGCGDVYKVAKMMVES